MERFALYYDAGVANQRVSLPKAATARDTATRNACPVRHAARCRQRPSPRYTAMRGRIVMLQPFFGHIPVLSQSRLVCRSQHRPLTTAYPAAVAERYG
jgi:hypothetical protein